MAPPFSETCRRGHDLTGPNLRIRRQGKYRLRQCKVCELANERIRYRAKVMQQPVSDTVKRFEYGRA